MRVPRISVVIPTRNGVATLPALLEVLAAQDLADVTEVIAVDSGSTDGTPALLDAHGVVRLTVDAGQFDHGGTRNLGVERARGALVVLLVQDALPVSTTWLRTLTARFDREPNLAGAIARQVPRPDASALARHYLRGWAACDATPWHHRLPGGQDEFDRLSPPERLVRCAFDNVASCIRRSVWERHPFRATPMAEDLAWGRDVLLAGHALALVPEAVVVHSHDRAAAYEFARTRTLHARLYELFGLQTIPSWPWLLRAAASSLAVHAACEWRTPARWPRAAALAVAWPLGQFLGARDARLGRPVRPPAGTV